MAPLCSIIQCKYDFYIYIAHFITTAKQFQPTGTRKQFISQSTLFKNYLCGTRFRNTVEPHCNEPGICEPSAIMDCARSPSRTLYVCIFHVLITKSIEFAQNEPKIPLFLRNSRSFSRFLLSLPYFLYLLIAIFIYFDLLFSIL